ncbi:hypothetical protein [Archangium sp.]|jgi:hypothetical protein|uniref:hypothetical protein n=1 Tax=Archangium sp. TaxID=1872627 RepID=UPI00286B0A7C|nr:hypothetical protein [Archangium sp.]HLM43737.1 hypothetical protein [Myxococcaceae bacterium]
MTNTTESNPGERIADFTLPEGCMLCGGAVSIRSTPSGGAHSYCAHCHWLSRTRLRMRKDGLEIAYAAQGFA